METSVSYWLVPVRQIAETGGPVVVILMSVAVLTLAVVLYKTRQFTASGVGRHRALAQAVAAWDGYNRIDAQTQLSRSTSYLAPVVAFEAPSDQADRLRAETEVRFGTLERGFRLLDPWHNWQRFWGYLARSLA